MTKPRSEIADRLARHGRPMIFMDGRGAAEMLGMPYAVFEEKLWRLEVNGFPKLNPFNGKYHIESVARFALDADLTDLRTPEERDHDERATEIWGGVDGNGKPCRDAPKQKHILR